MALEKRFGWLAAAALSTLPIVARAELYVCTVNGHTVSGDLPPPQCKDTVIRVLNRDGSLNRLIEPPLTPEQRKAQELEDRKRHEREMQAQEQLRKDRALLETYATEEEIDASRDRALASRQTLIDRATQQLKEYKADRKRLDDEAEFYVKRTLPDKLKRGMQENEELQQHQLHTIDDIRAEMKHINERYDADLQRFRELVTRGATPVQRKTDP
jgi:hypothetical protein